MTEETTTTTTTEELPPRCFVRHEDAGGQCERPGAMRVYGIGFFAEHGEEVRLGAALEAYADAGYFFDRFRNPRVPVMSNLVDRELAAAGRRLLDEAPGDRDYQQALVRAYPNAPDGVRELVENWERDEEPHGHTVVDYLLDSLGVLHKLMRIAREEGEHWLVEVLEKERESIAAQAVVALERADRRWEEREAALEKEEQA